MKTDNEIIAEFMNCRKDDVNGTICYAVTFGRYVNMWVSPGQMQYDTSWEWLMPVLEKILKDRPEGETMQWPYVYKVIADTRIGTPLNIVFERVVNYVKTQNKTFD
jgi:hypothetical protein